MNSGIHRSSFIIHHFKSTFQYALSMNVFQLSYLGLPSLMANSGLRFGLTGARMSLR